MEKQDLVFNPAIEIVTFGVVDVVGTSYLPEDNETPTLPPGTLL